MLAIHFCVFIHVELQCLRCFLMLISDLVCIGWLLCSLIAAALSGSWATVVAVPR